MAHINIDAKGIPKPHPQTFATKQGGLGFRVTLEKPDRLCNLGYFTFNPVTNLN